MADFSWAAKSPLDTDFAPGRHGEKVGPAGVTLTEVTGFALVQVMARRGRWSDVAAAAVDHFGIEPPAKPLAVAAGSRARMIWSGPQQFFALFPEGYGVEPSAGLARAFDGLASLSDQSDGRVLLRLSGPRVRDALAKVCSLDLHPAAFPVGTAAATSVDHTGVNIWRAADGPDGALFEMLMMSTFAGTLWHLIIDQAAEYGVEVGRRSA